METPSGRWQGSSISSSSSRSRRLRMWALGVALLCIVLPSVTAAGKGIRIDTHAHIVPPFYSDLLRTKGLTAGGLAIPKWNPADHLAFMDSLDIQLAVLSVSTPGARFAPSDVEEGRELARQLNEYAHQTTVEYPERFQFFATLTLPDVEGSVAEAVYALDTLKAAGVVLMANSFGEYLGSKKFDPLMEVLNEREAVVFVHPNKLDLAPVTNDLGDGQKLTISPNVVDFLLDTTRAAENLIVMRVTERYPKIKFLLAHSGGVLPFAAYRLAGALSQMMGAENNRKFLLELQKFYVDVALSTSPSSLPSILSFMPLDHITYGSDYPYCPEFGIKRSLGLFEKYPMDQGARDSINFLSATPLLENALSHWRSVWHQEAKDEL